MDTYCVHCEVRTELFYTNSMQNAELILRQLVRIAITRLSTTPWNTLKMEA